jgi:hypothetical protein
MRRSLQVGILATGVLSLLVGAGGAVAGSRLDALLARLKGADVAGRRQVMRSLSAGERKQLHAEYRALSPEGKQAADTALGRGKAKSERKGKGPGPWPTLQYDTGVAHSSRDNSSDVVGNQFNVGFQNPHTITVVTFQPAGTFGSIAMRVYDGPVGTVAPVIASGTFPGPSFTWNLPDIFAHNGSFLIGMLQSGSSTVPSPTVAAIAVDVNNGGFGFHGMNIKLAGSGFAPNATVAPGVPYNAILRATGPNLPVELMDFEVQ